MAIRIQVLRKMKYEDRFIYIMQFSTVFQYLFAEDEDVYQNHIVYHPNWLTWGLWKLGLRSSPYTPHEIEEGEQIILSGAMATIDQIRDPNFVKDNPAARQKAMAMKNALDLDQSCMWQTRQAHDNKFYYMCLRHGKAVKMEEGEAPKHD